jgi:DHA2 family multidrug resistance protein
MAAARGMAQGNIYSEMLRQSTMLSYLDVIAALAVGSACMVPLVFFMKKRGAAKGPVAMH